MKNNIRFIKNIAKMLNFVDINKIRINIFIDNERKKFIFINILYFPNFFLNLISQKQFARNNIFIKFI